MNSNAWTHLTPRGLGPQQRQSATLTAVDHASLLMFGGRQGEARFMNDTWLFDTVACVWRCVHESDEIGEGLQSVTRRPAPRWAHSAVRFGDRVLVFGGSAPGRCFDDLHWFDISSLQWQLQIMSGISTPSERSGHCACAVGGSMYVFGGNTTKASFNDLWHFEVARGVWHAVQTQGEEMVWV
jgi:hypothetical protein